MVYMSVQMRICLVHGNSADEPEDDIRDEEFLQFHTFQSYIATFTNVCKHFFIFLFLLES